MMAAEALNLTTRLSGLFAGIVSDAHALDRYDQRESYFCRADGAGETRVQDPHYTIRAWRGVVTYLLRQQEFLYE